MNICSICILQRFTSVVLYVTLWKKGGNLYGISKMSSMQQQISDTVEKCPHCGNTISHNVLPVSTPAPSVQNNIPKFLTIAALILAIIGTCFLIKGFHVKNVYKNYSSSDYYYDYDDNVNAYVGGDAYNYIINGTYFAGFMALTGTMYLCATGLFCTSLLLNNKKQTVEVRPTSDTIAEELPNI